MVTNETSAAVVKIPRCEYSLLHMNSLINNRVHKWIIRSRKSIPMDEPVMITHYVVLYFSTQENKKNFTE